MVYKEFAKAFTAGITAASIFFVIMPYIFININNRLSLPIIHNSYLVITGIIIIITSLSCYAYLAYTLSVQGKGTPAPIQPPKKLITTNLYSKTRNPMYLCYIAILFSLFLVLGHLLLLAYTALMIISIHIYVLHEEKILLKKHKKKYSDYTKKVPRWF